MRGPKKDPTLAEAVREFEKGKAEDQAEWESHFDEDAEYDDGN